MNLSQRKFSQEDQERFASLSGDYNPMHMDRVLARRTQAGAPVVHGIHLLLWSLESLAAAQPDLAPMRSVRVQLNKFIYLDEQAEVELTQQTASRIRLSVNVDGVTRSRISVELGEAAELTPAWASDTALELIPFSREPFTPAIEELDGFSGRIDFQATEESATAMFPAASKWLGYRRVAALGTSTHLVGMIAPGLHSIYSELSVRACQDIVPADSLAFRVTAAVPRYRSLEQEIAGGGIAGTAIGYMRNPPVEQLTMTSLAGTVAPDEFAGSVALVVGGSRGLGELTAKLIASGGGKVIVTWQSGKVDAEKVAEEIRAAGGSCETLAYDARKSPAEQLAPISDVVTHAYYFATPTIYRPQAEMFDAERLKDLLTIYVDGFWSLSRELSRRNSSLSLFYPSTVFVAEHPPGMTEYAMAKSAGEILCAEMNETLAPLRVTASRLPRLPTDQTVSMAVVDTADPLETMLPIVREVQSPRV